MTTTMVMTTAKVTKYTGNKFDDKYHNESAMIQIMAMIIRIATIVNKSMDDNNGNAVVMMTRKGRR